MKNDWQKSLKTWEKQPFLKRLFSKYPKAKVYLVGGAVRDAILGHVTKDYDFVVAGISKNELEKFLATQGKVNLVGKHFGVFKFKPKKWVGPLKVASSESSQDLDIALPRTEHTINQSGAYRDFAVKSDPHLKIEDDLSRRDFTINALAWDLKENKLIDLFDGLSDLKKGIIRTVGKPNDRFKEDYSRMLRAIRFACQLNFEIETQAWATIKKNIKQLNKVVENERIVAAEIIAKELVKAISKNSIWALELLDQSGAIKILFPELLKQKDCPQPKIFHSEGDAWVHMVIALETLQSKAFTKEFKNQPASPEVIWAVLFHDIGKPYTLTMADRIRFNNHDNYSAKLFEQIAERLRLSSAGLDTAKILKLILKHMLTIQSQVVSMKDTTLEKYFFNPLFPGDELLMVMFADISVTIPPSGKPDFTSFNLLKKRIAQLAKAGKNNKVLPKPLINGNEIIKKFKLKTSPQIGILLEILREAQLAGKIKNKEQAYKYAKRFIKK